VTVDFCRVSYDIQAVASTIRRSDVPDRFATDLEMGWAVLESWSTITHVGGVLFDDRWIIEQARESNAAVPVLGKPRCCAVARIQI
jgi:hypothetical protein